VPKNWKITKIPNILFFQEGPGVRKWQFHDTGVKLVNVGNINNGQITLNTTKIHLSEDEAYEKYSHFLIDEGDLLIACSGIVVSNFHNKIAFVEKEHLPLCLNTSTMRFKALDEKCINLNYFRYFLQTNHFTGQLQKLITGSAQLNFGPSHIKKIDILLPPLAEQQKIASVLDAADSLRQKDQQLIKKYTALSQSLFLEMFGDPVSNPMEWDRKTIRDLVSEVKYGTSSKAEDDGKYPYLRMNNITYQGYMNFDSLKYINVTDKDKEKYVVKKGDILFNRTNSKELVGKTGLYNENTEMIIAGYLIRVRTNEFSNPYYIWAYLNSIHGKLILTNMCKSIVGMANINAQELQDIKILIPPIILQTQFAERIQAIEAQKQLALASLQKSENLFNSLLQRAFKGELTA
jgi:type I restriction enzyme S subunit